MSQTQTNTQVMTQAEMLAEITRLKAQISEARKLEGHAIKLKISEKGALSVYGLGRFPVTLYKSQWERLIKAMPEIQSFIKANEAQLKVKGE